MRVTDKDYVMDGGLKKKIDLMIKRTTGKNKDDNLVLIDGDEGSGKTNLELEIAYYVSSETKRPFSLKNVFFDLNKLIDFAIKTEEQIICWDEGALGGLAIEWWKKNQIKFMKLLMVARKKRHFYIICIPKFFKINEMIVVDRSVALIHTYQRRNTEKGHFLYFMKSMKEALYQDWKKTRRRNYWKYKTLYGTFPEALAKIVDEEAYEKMKDEAIMSINDDKMSHKEEKLIRLQYKISNIKCKSLREAEKLMDIPNQTLGLWRRLPEKYPFLLGK